jgi:hypothetical protein
MRRYAVVGTGARAEMFVRALTTTHADRAELVALCDPNPLRMAAHQRWLAEAGHPAVAEYPPERVAEMIAKEDVGTLVVTSVDRTHAGHIVTGLEAGCDVRPGREPVAGHRRPDRRHRPARLPTVVGRSGIRSADAALAHHFPVS